METRNAQKQKQNLMKTTRSNSSLAPRKASVRTPSQRSKDSGREQPKKKPKCLVESARDLARPNVPYWAKAPEEDPPYSDWKLIVIYYDDLISNTTGISNSYSNNTREASYSVHRFVLGHKCDFFDRVFRGGFSESREQESTHPLPREYCELGVVSISHFEALLDWFYSKKPKFTLSSSIGMLHLSNYFAIETLNEEVWTYIRSRLQYCSSFVNEKSSSILAVFYRSAKILGIDHLQHEVVELCIRRPSYMGWLTEALQDIELWEDVFKARTKVRKLRSSRQEVWSELFSEFVRKYPASVDAETFKFFTCKKMLPIVSSDAAISLMEHEQRLLVGSASFTESSTCLQRRCARALFDPETGKWRIGDDATTKKKLRKLSSVVLSEILMQSIRFDTKESKGKKECSSG